MADDLKNSVQNDRRTTGNESKLAPEQALEILQESVKRCVVAGIDAKVAPLHGQHHPTVLVVLAGVVIVDGMLVLA